MAEQAGAEQLPHLAARLDRDDVSSSTRARPYVVFYYKAVGWKSIANGVMHGALSVSFLPYARMSHNPGHIYEFVGDYAKWHPHIRALVADGLFSEIEYYCVMPKVAIRSLSELFRSLVLNILKDEEKPYF